VTTVLEILRRRLNNEKITPTGIPNTTNHGRTLIANRTADCPNSAIESTVEAHVDAI
jgi:H2-forming N5,N10-methylenetetrahydromethanopterin dehydrogenase-like enzyme